MRRSGWRIKTLLTLILRKAGASQQRPSDQLPEQHPPEHLFRPLPLLFSRKGRPYYEQLRGTRASAPRDINSAERQERSGRRSPSYELTGPEYTSRRLFLGGSPRKTPGVTTPGFLRLLTPSALLRRACKCIAVDARGAGQVQGLGPCEARIR